MQYGQVVRARFLARPNRFIAHAALESGETVVCHVKNTGRCRELLTPEAVVYLERAANPHRKTAYDLIAVEKGGRLINMDAQAPNRAFAEWARTFDPAAETVKPEFVFGQSRLDFCLAGREGLHLVEVKGVTLEESGVCAFPDAPTLRGAKHLRGLTRAAAEGYGAGVLFVIQMADVKYLHPNDATDPDFGAALRDAAGNGVHILAMDCAVTEQSMTIRSPVEVRL